MSTLHPPRWPVGGALVGGELVALAVQVGKLSVGAEVEGNLLLQVPGRGGQATKGQRHSGQHREAHCVVPLQQWRATRGLGSGSPPSGDPPQGSHPCLSTRSRGNSPLPPPLGSSAGGGCLAGGDMALPGPAPTHLPDGLLHVPQGPLSLLKLAAGLLGGWRGWAVWEED